MRSTRDVYLEVGTKKVFAGALDWPGWCRSGRDEHDALEALVAYGPRYRRALGRAGRGFTSPRGPSRLHVVERLKGDATTDFGAPGTAPTADERPLADAEARRQVALLKAIWQTFDRISRAAQGKALTKGPRGGGRALDAIV